MASALSCESVQWLQANAEALDQGGLASQAVLNRLAGEAVFGLGLDAAWGGVADSDIGHAIEAVAELARHSFTAGFVVWAQRVVIETLVRSPNRALAQATVPGLLQGALAGASGLSNAIKSLGGFDRMRIQAQPHGHGWRLNGRIDWITNAQPGAFLATAAAALPQGGVAIVALPHDLAGLGRSCDLPLMALRGSATATLELNDVCITEAHVLQADARQLLPGLRPRLVGLQCGLSIGLAHAALDAAQRCGLAAGALADSHRLLTARLAHSHAALVSGVRQEAFVTQPAELFRLRIGLADIVQEAVELELQSTGGAAYLQGDQQAGFARRWREAAFVPIVTPSLVQLRAELARLAGAA